MRLVDACPDHRTYLIDDQAAKPGHDIASFHCATLTDRLRDCEWPLFPTSNAIGSCVESRPDCRHNGADGRKRDPSDTDEACVEILMRQSRLSFSIEWLRPVILLMGLALCLSLDGPPQFTFGETGEVAREALRRGGFPWYDAAKDDIKPTRVSKPPRELDVQVNAPWIAWSSIGIIIISLAIAAAVILGYFAWRRWKPWQGRRGEAARIAAQLRELPLVPDESPHEDDLLLAAERAAAAGDYGRAIIWLYAYQLTELDRHRVIRLVKGKTNRQYLRELGRQSPIRPLLERTIVTFEEVYFGGRTLTAERYESCYREIPRFRQWLTEIAA